MPDPSTRARRPAGDTTTVGDDGATLTIRTGTGDGARPMVGVYTDPATGAALQPIPAERQLPEHRGKIGRINAQIEALTEDVKAWVDLRVDLVKAEVDEKVEMAKWGVVAGVPALIGLWFVLLFAAFGIGALLGEYAWGFGIVALAMLLVAGAVFWFKIRPLKNRADAAKRARYEHKRATGPGL